MNFKVQKSECSVSEPLFVYSFQVRSEVFCLAEECLGSRGMLPQKIFKIQGPRLAKKHFLRFQLDKSKSARSLALKFGHFKKLSARFGGGGQLPPLAPTSCGPAF